MTDLQWHTLLRILHGERLHPPPVGFLADGPWMADSRQIPLLDYFTDDRLWLEANLHAHQQFPDVLWFPGFWAEYGMISNPPSFGGKCIWPEEGFPSCEPVLRGIEDIQPLAQPNVRSDGLLPFIIQRLKRSRKAMESAGHRIRFATSHGPLTIASYLMGHTEFFTALKPYPSAVRQLLSKVTGFIMDWLRYQKETFPSIDGTLILEDFMGFIGPGDVAAFAIPYLRRIFGALPVSVRFLHNDAFGLITARHLPALGVNLFNFSFEHDYNQIRDLAGEEVTLMGNIPPRDVLGLGSCADIRQCVTRLMRSVPDHRRMIVSAGGFAPTQFTAPKIEAFCQAVSSARS